MYTHTRSPFTSIYLSISYSHSRPLLFTLLVSLFCPSHYTRLLALPLSLLSPLPHTIRRGTFSRAASGSAGPETQLKASSPQLIIGFYSFS